MLRDKGVAVAPFKAQNMSNNSFVTREGLEMGRAQVVQAQAAGIEPCVDMNPVLLKPSSDTGAQVVVHGKPIGNALAKDYFRDTDALFAKAQESLERLRLNYEAIVMEGAGSCAEVNLRSRDFVNFRMAHAAEAPVVIVADIDRGGVFAQIVGTLEVLPPEDRERVAGFIINRFRGDARLFEDGMAWIEKRTGLPVLGLVPWFYHIEIESEDGMPLDTRLDPAEGPSPGFANIAVIRLPHISNFTDFDALSREPAVRLHYLARPRTLAGYDLVMLPGSKNVRADLDWMRQVGWEPLIKDFDETGGSIGGVCGGYQMLGRTIRDPHGLEGVPGDSPGLAMLPVETELKPEKTLARTEGVWLANGERVAGYEIHMGETQADADAKPVLRIMRRGDEDAHGFDGVQLKDGRIWGTYLHGLFDAASFRRRLLQNFRPDLEVGEGQPETIDAFRDRQYGLLAAHLSEHLDLARLAQSTGLPI